MRIGESWVGAGEPATFTCIDPFTLDNRDFLAYCYSDRLYDRDALIFSQYTQAGLPIYSVRPPVTRANDTQQHLSWTGRFGGKVLLRQHLMDRPCWPPVAVRYYRSVQEHLGPATDDRFRIWWTEHAEHTPAMTGTVDATRSVDYRGSISQGLRDVSAWAEEGRSPAPSTSYEYVDGQVLTPDSAAVRGGIQPVVTASANGGAGARSTVGEPVDLTFSAEVPPGSGTIVAAAWDLDGSGTFATVVDGVDGTQTTLSYTLRHVFPSAGKHFATVRIQSQRDGDTSSATERIENLARLRVIVE